LSEHDEIQDMVEEAKSPKTFNIVSVLSERAYPKTSVAVSLDEATAYEAALVKEELDALGTKGASISKVSSKIDELQAKLSELIELMNKSTYVFHIRGISEGKREELAATSRKKYPVEYEQGVDISALLSNSGERQEKPSPERDNLFTDLLWVEHIEKIEDPDGNIQAGLTYSDIRALRNNLPLSALAKINSEIEKVRTATAVFMMETGEDFLAKP
jgi:hypothetical protein